MNNVNRFKPIRTSEDTWIVEETVYHPSFEPLGGTLFCIGNGLLGLRGSYEELGTMGVQGLFMAGVYRKEAARQFCAADTFCRKKYIFSEELMPTVMDLHILQNLPDPLYIKVFMDGVPFRLWDGKLLSYQRRLDLRSGELRRTVRWDNGEGKITRIESARFCSMADRHLIGVEYRVTPENWSGSVRIESGIDASLNAELQQTLLDDAGSSLLLKSTVHGVDTEVYQAVRHRFASGASAEEAEWESTVELRRYKKIIERPVAEGETLTLEKFSLIGVSAEGEAAVSAFVKEEKALDYQAALQESARHWADLWKEADVEIDGDLPAQHGMRFALFHLMIASPRDDDRVSIGAKALTGQGYSGHVFWDTDIHLSPFYQWVFPEWGKGHARYRVRHLDAARQRAAEEGHQGARFPWQSGVEGYEHAPEAITCSRTQIHVVPDVAYMTLRYLDISGDTEWFAREGYEVVTECARYMVERTVYNEAKDRYEIHGVGGPDEYHPVTDNNAYTNYLTAYVLGRAVAWSEQHSDGLLSKEEATRWREISQKLYQPSDPDTGLIPQCDGFYDLKDEWNEAGSTWGGPGAEYHECKGLKQPDVLLLLVLLPQRFSTQHLLSNWDYYERFVQHGSSLSPATHALLAAKLGLTQKAKEYFHLSASFDFVDYNSDSAAGIHIGNCGNLWQAVVYGFAGMEMRNGALVFHPNLPVEWNEIRFRITYGGSSFSVYVSNNAVSVVADAGNPASVGVQVGAEHGVLAAGESCTIKDFKRIDRQMA